MFNEASSLPALADFSSQRGDSWEQSIYLVNNIDGLDFSQFDFFAIPEQSKIDITGVQAKLEIRKAGRYVRRITNNGIGGITTERGRITLKLTAAQTQLLKPDKYQYELRLTLANGSALTYIKGFFRIIVDQDQIADDVLLVGSLDALLFLTGQSIATVAKRNSNTASSIIIEDGILQTRLFFKAPNGTYYIQHIGNNGTIYHRPDDPSRYTSVIVCLPPLGA